MTEITYADLLEVFYDYRNVDKVRTDDSDIFFDLREPAPDSEKGRVIRECDVEDVRRFFSCSLQRRPFAKHLLQVLWIREVKYAMGPLNDDDFYNFAHKAFGFYGIGIDDETMEDELLGLLSEDYLRENSLGIHLTSKGKRFAEEMFKTMKTLISNSVESPSTTSSNLHEISKFFVEAFDRFTASRVATSSSPDEPDLSPADESKGSWISRDEFCERKNIRTTTAARYRYCGKKSKDGLRGKDLRGNYWRKYTTGTSESPEYFWPEI